MRHKYSIKSNLIIKEPLAKQGILCANPERAERLLNHFPNRCLICCSWGIKIHAVTHNHCEFFIGYVPVGAAGAGLAYFEAFAAGAEVIVRYGSNDDKVEKKDLHNFILVEAADNLVSLPAALEQDINSYHETIDADASLIDLFKQSAAKLGINVKSAICHHVEDYHAYRFPELLGDDHTRQAVLDRIAQLEAKRPDLHHCRDMESAALFFRAKQFGKKAVTVLQSVLKPIGDDQAYEGEYGELAKSLEKTFLDWILLSFET